LKYWRLGKEQARELWAFELSGIKITMLIPGPLFTEVSHLGTTEEE
jgi:hypothetical protein